VVDVVREGGTGWFDRVILLTLRVPSHLEIAFGPSCAHEAERDVSALVGLTLISIFAMAMLAIHCRRLQALVFASTVLLAQIASEVLKMWIDRPRLTLAAHLDLV
jgi:undecaprenyl-diphosphatase